MRTHCITIDLANQGCRQVRARFDGGRMSSDGGALLLQAVDQRIGLTRRLAACFVDHRNRRPAARPAGGAFLPRLLRLLLLPPAVCDLRATPAVRAAATVQPGRGGRGRGRVAADRGADPAALAAGAGGGAGGQPALRGDQPGAGADRDPAAVRAAVLRARGHGEPDQGAAAGPVRGPDFGGDAAGEPVAAVLGPVRGGAAGGVATTRAGGDGAGAGAVRDDPGAAAEGGRGGAGERAEGLGVVVLGVSAPGAVRAQPGAVAGGDARIACGPAGETAGAPRAAASGRCVHPAPIRRAGRAECPGTGPG